jgi:magnesium-transporting ATPase (P-type)
VTLIVAPVFFAATIYLILGRLISRKGAQYSFLKPKTYLWIFCTCDVLSLLVQGGGGTIASEEAEKKKSTKLGTNVIVAGIIFQLITMLVFSVCGISFLIRSRHAPQPKKETIVTFATILAFICIFIRNCYRTIGFLQGWTGFLSSHEIYFIALDACMILIASITLNIFDPAALLRDDDKLIANGDVCEESSTKEIIQNKR